MPITYADKVTNDGATAEGQWSPDDANEVKSVFNASEAAAAAAVALAQTTADGAVGDAAAAQATAATADGKAVVAQTAADGAQTAADTAQATADGAVPASFTVPIPKATVQQYWEAVGGYYYVDPATIAAARQVQAIAFVSGDFEFDGYAGINQFIAPTDNTTVKLIANAPHDRYTLAIKGGKSPSLTVTIDASLLFPDLPAAGVVALGETLTLVLRKFTADGEVFSIVESPSLVGDPPLTAPTVVAWPMLPVNGAALQTFDGAPSVTGNEQPTLAYTHALNGDVIGGATARAYSATTGQDGEFVHTVVATNATGVSSPFVAKTYIGPPPPRFVSANTYRNSLSTTVNLPLLAGVEFSPAEGDFALCVAAQQDIVDNAIPTDFDRIATSVPRQSGTSQSGDHFRMEVSADYLTAANITDGFIGGVYVRSNSMSNISIWRGVSSYLIDTANRTAGGILTAAGVDIQRLTLTNPARALVFAGSGRYPDNAKVGVLTGYAAGPVNADAPNFLASYGVQFWHRQLASGLMPAGAITSAGAGDVSWRSISVALYGEAV